MPDKSSAVNPDVVRKIAALARLTVPDEELPLWTEQLGRIVSYIDQLKTLPEESGPRPSAPPTPLRPDTARDGGGRESLEENEPLLLHDHGVVPRVVGAASEDRRAASPGQEPSSRPGPPA